MRLGVALSGLAQEVLQLGKALFNGLKSAIGRGKEGPSTSGLECGVDLLGVLGRRGGHVVSKQGPTALTSPFRGLWLGEFSELGS